MNDESNAWVDAALAALAATDAGLGPPAHVQAAVLGEWDEHHVRQARRKPIHRGLVWALVPAAAGVLVGVAVLQRGPVTPSEPYAPPPVERAASVDAPAAADSPTTLPTETGIATPLTHPVAVSHGPRPVADAGYVIVPDPLVDPTTLRIVRVRMSRTALATLGMPLANPDADSLMEVEMLVGDDGVAQSIRRAALVSEPMDAGGER